MQEPVILGISPGKEMMGIALIVKGTLVDWRIRSTKKADKSKRYMTFIQNVSHTHRVSVIAVKTLAYPRSMYRKNFISDIQSYCQEQGIECRMYTLSQLKKLAVRKDCKTRKELMTAIAEKKPELIPVLRKERTNRNAYYIKIFEAVAAALVTEKIMNARNAVNRLSH